MATGLQLSHASIFQEAIKNGLQSFVLPSTLVATNAVGTPASGYFYSTITNRAPIANPANNLKVSMGVERIQFSRFDGLQSEIGPFKERVWEIPGEDRLRFIGEWSFTNDISKGPLLRASVASPQNPCFIEVAFYGTGLNLLLAIDSSNRVGITCSVDQGDYGSELFPSGTVSGTTNTRNFASNQVLKVTSGLALGFHTAVIRFTSAQEVYGLEILNQQTTNLIANSGTAFIDGLKVVSPGTALAYRSGVTGTKGGRQLVYLKTDGTFGSSFTAADPTIKYMANANHSNEELFKTYAPRDFSAASANDFSRVFGANAAVTHTLSDGTTTLSTNGGQISVPAGNTLEGLVPGAANNWISFTFIGTGIDITCFRSTPSTQVMDTFSVTVDGVAAGNLPDSVLPINATIASGLPYGTHVVKITRLTATGAGCWIGAFKVYQPKKPTLPTGCMELADYNVLGEYVQNTTAGDAFISAGVIRKNCLREAYYLGSSWVATLTQGSSVSGYTLDGGTGAGTVGASATFHFWGTGAEIRLYQPASGSATFAINGSSNFSTMPNGSGGSGITTAIYHGTTATPPTLNNTTGVLAGDMISRGSGVCFSNLPLGLHTITITKNASPILSIEAFDVITPIYSPSYDPSYKPTSAPLVSGSSVSDLRAFDFAEKSSASQQKTGRLINTWFVRTSAADRQTINATVPVPVSSLSITVSPSSVNSKFLISAVINGSMTHVASTFLYKNGNNILPSAGTNRTGSGPAVTTYIGTSTTDYIFQHLINFIDAPATLSSVTYDIRHVSTWPNPSSVPVAYASYINNRQSNDMAVPSYMIIMEFES